MLEIMARKVHVGTSSTITPPLLCCEFEIHSTEAPLCYEHFKPTGPILTQDGLPGY